MLATKEGTSILDGGLKIENVLYVPGLNCNLISISQLIDETNCVLHFTDILCVMQDRTLKMLIGAGERRDGLYFSRVSEMKKHIRLVESISLIYGIKAWDIRL